MSNNGRILAVDDTPASLKLLSDLLRNEGYDVRATTSGDLALHAAISSPPELILLDIRMPGIDGFEVCRRLKDHDSTADIPIIFVSAMSEIQEKIQGFELGAVDFVTKPYQREELLARVRTHLKLVRLSNHLEEQIAERSNELLASQKKLHASMLDFVTAIATTVEIRDPYTAGHQRRVAQLAKAIATQLQLSENQIEGLYLASVVHDIGKIQIPTELLSKPGRINELEYGLIKLHAAAGYDILKSINFPWPIAQTVLQHHERIDGSGYPRQIKGNDILLEAQILAISDVVEAMYSHRPYRPGLGVDAALDEILTGKGQKYNATIVDICVDLFKHQGFMFQT